MAKALISDEKFDQYVTVLKQVITVSEAARLWCVDRKMITLWLESGLIVGFKSGGTWLVAYQSLVEFRGQPVG